MKTIAIMQPYFMPYYGYFQLIDSVDEFVLYDNIKYTKRGWINRNRVVMPNGEITTISVPLKKDSDYLNVDQRYISSSFDSKKLVGRLLGYYKKSPHTKILSDFLTESINENYLINSNLFHFIERSITKTLDLLEIRTPVIRSSTIEIDHSLVAEDKVIAICQKMNATGYVNSMGGIDLYDQEEFLNHGINLQFLESLNVVYPQTQSNQNFHSRMSIIDMIANLEIDDIKTIIREQKSLN